MNGRQEDLPANLIERIRQLMPVPTLMMLHRTLTSSEAKVIAEQQAEALHRLLNIQEPQAEVELLCELPSLDVKFVANLPVSGCSEWIHGRWVIGINRSDSLWRCRATLCHELKHILDDPVLELLDPRTDREHSHVPQRAESICNYFAGCALVPRDWLHRVWIDGTRSVDGLAACFNVSRHLIRVRLRQTGLARTATAQPGSCLRRYTRQLADRRPCLTHRRTNGHRITWSPVSPLWTVLEGQSGALQLQVN
jgi:Zn-dependent peptidase ImmA (M78 family)